MTKTIKRAILFLLVIMFYFPLRSIADDPGLGDGGDDTQDVPFDSGVSVLIAAGIAYGLKKVYDTKKQKNYTKY